MNMNTEILSCSAAKHLIRSGFPENTAVISFYDPKTKGTHDGNKTLNFSGVCSRVFHVEIHDIDIEILSDYGLTFETYFPEADELAQFIKKAKHDGCQIICQCEYGQSRSAACAAAIKEYYDKSIERINNIDLKENC